MDVRSPFFQNIATVLIGVMFLNPIVSTAADLAVDAAAGGNTSLGAAANGVPVVNIATPNGNGLSHNKFSDYNVGEQGLILNNATNKLQSTQLGGYILGNPNLNGRAAGVILNEVTGTNPSQLKGYTEVAGQGAHVIVANPHGITCDGCGFINTPRATLSTGAPVVENGALKRYDVDGGQIRIEGQGLNASNVDQFELITRSAQINAELHARQLAMVTGRNDVDAATLAATAKADDGTDKPQLAIDSSALGGMYAGAIRLVGTEQGVGVKLAGDMAASGGDIQIDANGKLTLARTAASGNLTANATDIELTRSTYASGNARLTTGTLDNQERLAAGGDLRLNATHIDNPGRLEAGVRSDGSANTDNLASVLDIQGGTLRNRGTVNAQGSLTTDLATLDNQSAELVASGSAQIKASTLDNRQGGQLIGRQDLTLDGQTLDNRGGTVASNKALTVTARDRLDNRQDGLILSKADGLTLDTAVLDNQSGTVQADSGELKATASTLDNRNGKLLTGQGALTVDAQDLRNQQGRLIAQNGTLTARSDTLDNTAGRLQGDSLDLTTRTRLDNSQGHITATQGNLSLTHGELLNDNGQIQAKHSLTVNADSLRNHSGSLGADTIDLTLGGLLDNSGGLVEAAQTLSLDLNDARNANGKLRALGSSGESVFRLGGRFDNDNGLVEIGNAAFRLSSTQLSNQGGTLRHVGNQGFGLNLADAGQAGGRFLTNGTLSLDVADWTNSSLLQAQRIDLKVGRFTQTATGQLVSIDDITASGTDWTNDGLIETQGKLQLALSGRYQGNGSLKSQSDMTVSAASAELGSGAQLRSGGNGDFRLGGALTSAGQLSAAGDLLLKAGSVDNRGTLGAAKALRIESDSLRNERGLVFSGADMVLRTGSLTNLLGDLYSLGSLSVAKDEAGAQLTRLENISGSLESSGDMSLRAAVLSNRKETFVEGRELTYGYISVVCYDCSGDHHNVDYVATERFKTIVASDSAAGRINSGGNLDIQGGAVSNLYSSLSATGNITIVATSLDNTGAASGTIERTRRFNTGRVTDGTDERFRGNYIDPYNARPMPKEMPGALYAWNLVSDIETRTPTGSAAPAIIQAGGNVSIQATQPLTNDAVITGQAPQAGASRSLDSQVSDSSQPLVVRLNAQLAPDAQQQAINPVALPGFSLPQGQNGLFRVNTDPGHPYLIETNPVFASLSGFINSSYLLDRLGFKPDETQRRLGDGLYEQRLLREAVIARTGKRFLDGLASDEAQFKYLMDNALASKERLNLAPGIALSAEQVAALTHDIVWMEEQEVSGQKVLVPVLYLAQAKDRLAPSGALIQGRDVALISGTTLTNSGTLRASNNLQASALNISNSGLMQAGERLSLLATDSIRNARGGLINGKDVSAIALTGDITNERTISQESRSGRNFSQLTSVVDKAAGFEAGNSMTLTAGKDIQNIGGSLKAGGNATLKAGNDLVIASAAEENGSMRQDKRHFWSTTSTTQHGSDVQVGGDLKASAGQDLAVIASTVKAGGDVSLETERDITIAAAADETSSEYRYKRSGKKVNKEDSTVRQQAAVIEAGGGLEIEAGGNLLLSASQLKAGEEAYLYAGEQLALTAGQDSDYHLYDMKKKGAFGAKKSQRDEVTDVRNVGTTITTGGDLSLVSEGDQLYQRARLESGGNLTLDSGGAITFEAVKDLHQESHEKSKSSFVWNSMSGKGNTDETVLQSQLIAQGEIAIKAVDGLKIDIKEINQQSVSQTVDAMVAADPQLAWLKDVEQRGDVDWRRVKEIHDSFKYSHSGLGGGAAIIIAIIVAYFTAGAASGLIGSAAGATAGSGSAMAAAGTATASAVANGAAIGSTVAAGTANVALTAVASSAAGSAAVSTINNKGNLGAVVKDITSKDAIKGYVVTGVTAGLTAGVYDKWTSTNTAPTTTNGAPGNTGLTLNSGQVSGAALNTWSGVGKFAASQALQNGTSALVNKALGQDVSLNNVLQSTLSSTFMAAGFKWVGDFSDTNHLSEGGVAKIGLHAVMGGLAAEAAGGDFKTGALAAGANEALVGLLAEQYSQMTLEERGRLLVMNSQVLGVLTAAAQGGDEKAMQIGSAVAANSTQYNFLGHQSRELRDKLRKEVEQNSSLDAASMLIALEKADQQSDVLLNKYLLDQNSLSASERNALAAYLRVYAYEQTQKYGKETANQLVKALLTEGNRMVDYDRLYAGLPSDRRKEAELSREDGKNWYEKTFWQRDTSKNEEIYAKANGLLREQAERQGEANIGQPALYVLTGPLGTAIRAASVVNGVYQLDYGVEQALDGDAWNAAGNIVFGALGVAALGIPKAIAIPADKAVKGQAGPFVGAGSEGAYGARLSGEYTVQTKAANGELIDAPVPGPINFMGDADQFFKNASRRLDIDAEGFFDVVAHGSTKKIEITTANGTAMVDQRVVSRLIKNDPGYNGQPIRLLSCDTGACDSGFAQNLANKMGVPVKAPTNLVWAYGDGQMVVAPRASLDKKSPLYNTPDLSKKGTFKVFIPRRP